MSKTEGQYRGEFIVAELPGDLSRRTVTVTVAAATLQKAGSVLGKLSSDGSYVEYDNAGSDGSEAAAGVLYDNLDNIAGGSPKSFTAVVITNNARVRKADLQWASGLVDADKTAAYADLEGNYVEAAD